MAGGGAAPLALLVFEEEVEVAEERFLACEPPPALPMPSPEADCLRLPGPRVVVSPAPASLEAASTTTEGACRGRTAEKGPEERQQRARRGDVVGEFDAPMPNLAVVVAVVVFEEAAGLEGEGRIVLAPDRWAAASCCCIVSELSSFVAWRKRDEKTRRKTKLFSMSEKMRERAVK